MSIETSLEQFFVCVFAGEHCIQVALVQLAGEELWVVHQRPVF